jgi:tRNA G18 (ribose-2'-O)-methylase SpoU
MTESYELMMISAMENQQYLILANISKRSNLWQLINVGRAYRFRVIIIGMEKLMESNYSIDLSSACILFESLDEAKSYLFERNIPVIGIEITDSATPLPSFRFPSPRFALMPGNEGTGLNQKQRNICDLYVFIPQYGHGIESLNVTVATTIIMNEFLASL